MLVSILWVNADVGDYVMETVRISSASERLRCLYLLHCGDTKAEPIRFCITYPAGISEYVLLCVPAHSCPKEQVSVPQKSGLNPVHLCSYEAQEFLLGLILLTVFTALLNNSSFSLPFSSSPTPPSSLHFSPRHPSFSCVCLFLSLLLLSSFSPPSSGNCLCSAAQVWQWGVCGSWTSRTLWLLWWVAFGWPGLLIYLFGTTHKKLSVKTTTGFIYYLLLNIKSMNCALLLCDSGERLKTSLTVTICEFSENHQKRFKSTGC